VDHRLGKDDPHSQSRPAPRRKRGRGSRQASRAPPLCTTCGERHDPLLRGGCTDLGWDRFRKTVVVVDAISLLPLLDMFSSSSTSFTVLEGFKSLPLPKVIMGDLVGVENIVLDNPRPEMILAYLDRFPDYYTPCDLARDMWSDGLIASTCSLPAGSSNLPVPERREFYERFFSNDQ